MKKRFIFELIVGVIGLIAIILFGIKGSVVMVLIAFHILFCKKKLDEREIQLFYRIGNITAGVAIVVCVVVYYFSKSFVNGYRIGDLWLFWVIFSFFIAHGIVGIFIYKTH